MKSTSGNSASRPCSVLDWCFSLSERDATARDATNSSPKKNRRARRTPCCDAERGALQEQNKGEGNSRTGQNGDEGESRTAQSGDQGEKQNGQAGDRVKKQNGQSGDQGEKQNGQSGDQGDKSSGEKSGQK